MKWFELTDEQAVILTNWFRNEIEVKIDDSVYKFKRSEEIEFTFDALSGLAIYSFEEIFLVHWKDTFKEIWDVLYKKS